MKYAMRFLIKAMLVLLHVVALGVFIAVSLAAKLFGVYTVVEARDINKELNESHQIIVDILYS